MPNTSMSVKLRRSSCLYPRLAVSIALADFLQTQEITYPGQRHLRCWPAPQPRPRMTPVVPYPVLSHPLRWIGSKEEVSSAGRLGVSLV